MAVPTLAVVAAVHALTAAAFLLVARTLARRGTPDADRTAARAFILWWSAMAAYLSIEAALAAYAALTDPTPLPFLVARAVAIPLLVVACWGLVSHILYVYTGRRWFAPLLAVVYGALGVMFLFAGFVPVPEAVVVERWSVSLEGEGQTPLYRAVYGAIALTIIGSAIAYLTLLPKVDEPVRRLRVALVGGSIILWVGSGLAAFLSTNDLAKFFTLVGLGLATAGAVIVAYHPPARLRTWLERRPPRPPPEERRRRFEQRAYGLI